MNKFYSLSTRMLESAMLDLGIIGCGKVTTMFHLKAIKKIGNLSVRAVSDIDNQSMLKAQKTCGADRCYSNYLEMLDDSDIQAVVVCTPPHLHSMMVIKAVEKKKHVLCEKPLATTTRECLEVKKSSAGNNVIVMPVHNYLFTPSLMNAQSLVQKEAIGQLNNINISFENSLEMYRPKTDFRLKHISGIVEDLLPHALSISNWIGGRIGEVTGTQFWKKNHSVPDNAHFSLRTERGISLDVTLSWTRLIPCFRIGLIGSEGRIDLDLMRSPDTLRIASKGTETTMRSERGPMRYLKLMALEHPSFPNQYLHFLRVIEGKENALVTIEDEINMVQTMEEITSNMEDAKTTSDLL